MDGNDLISRAAAIAQIDKCVALSGIGLEPVIAVRDVKALISALPTVDAAPVVHGRWEAVGDCGITRCSACKWNFEGYINYNYCPNCGAKMETKNE